MTCSPKPNTQQYLEYQQKLLEANSEQLGSGLSILYYTVRAARAGLTAEVFFGIKHQFLLIPQTLIIAFLPFRKAAGLKYFFFLTLIFKFSLLLYHV